MKGLKAFVGLLLVGLVTAGCAIRQNSSSNAPSLPAGYQREASAPSASSELKSFEVKGSTYTVKVPADYRVNIATLDTGIAWALSPKAPEVAKERNLPVTIWLTPFREGGGSLEEGRVKLVELPLSEQVGNAAAYLTVMNFQATDDWLVYLTEARQEGLPQAAWTRIEAVSSSGVHRLIWQGNRSGGAYLEYAVGPSSIVVRAAHATGTSTVVDRCFFLRLTDGFVREIPVRTTSGPVSYVDNAFEIGDEGKTLRISPQDGEIITKS